MGASSTILSTAGSNFYRPKWLFGGESFEALSILFVEHDELLSFAQSTEGYGIQKTGPVRLILSTSRRIRLLVT
jgi:hypothetical protein